MSLGLSTKFNILERSPHDLSAASAPASESTASQKWARSRYTIRATTDDGRLVLWNTLSGKITAIKAEQSEAVLELLKPSSFDAHKNGVVEYLANRGYIVPYGTDEYRKFQQAFGQQHYRSDALELILLPSEDCNFRCTYCYEDFKRGTMLPEVREGIKNLINQRARRLNRLHISWFGGEPLYGWDAIEDLAPFFLNAAAEHDVAFSAHMTTNGYLLTPEVATKLLNWRITDFQITLDGLAEHHDHSRPARDGSPTFDRIFSNLKSLARRDDHFHVALRVNISRANASGLSQFVDLISESFTGDPRFTLSLKTVGKWGGPNDPQLDVCSGDESARIRQEITKKARQEGLNLGNIKNIAHLGSQVCYAARPYNFLIGATGKVMKCTIVLDKDDSNVVGQLTPDGSLKLNSDRMSVWTEPAFENDSQCRKCVVLPSCQGISCPLIRIENNSRPCIPARTEAKRDLLQLIDMPSATSRQVVVNTKVESSLGNSP